MRSMRIRGLLAGGVGAVLLAAHLQAMDGGLGVRGPLLVADHLYRLALVAAFVALLWAAGVRLREVLGLGSRSPVGDAAEAVAVGAGAWASLYLVLGAVGLLHPVIVALTVPAGAVLLRRELASLPVVVREVRSRLVEGPEPGWLRWTALATVGAAAFFLVVQALPPPTSWDTLMYHVEIPEAFLERGRIHLPTDNQHVAYVGLAHMLYLPMLVLGGGPAPALLGAAFTILLGPVVLDLGRRHLGGGSGALAAAALWGFTALLLVTADGRVEGILVFFLLLAHAALLDGRDGGAAPLRRLALLLGLAFAVKYNAALYGVFLGLLALPALIRLPRGVRARTLVAAVALGVVVVLPWLAKNQLLLGFPTYPYGTERVLPGWMAEVVGSRAYPSGAGQEIRRTLGAVREPLNLRDLLTAPERLSPETDVRFFRIPALLLLLPFGLLARRRREWTLLLLPALLYVAVLGYWRPRTNLRYLLPAVAPLTLCAAAGAAAIARRLPRTAGSILLAGVLAVSLGPAVLVAGDRLRATRTPLLAFGVRTPLQHLVEAFPAYAYGVALVDEHVPPEGRALLLFEARGHYFGRDVLQDNVVVNWPLLVETGLADRCLPDTGITHVLVGTGSLRFYLSRGASPSDLRWDRFDSFSERCLEPVAVEPSFELYRVRTGPAAPGRSTDEAGPGSP